jgi:hypothetical protein
MAGMDENPNREPIRIPVWTRYVRRFILAWISAWFVAAIAANELPPGMLKDLAAAALDVLTLGRMAHIAIIFAAPVLILLLGIYYRLRRD